MDYKKKKEYDEALALWRKEHNVPIYAKIPPKPQYRYGENAMDFAIRLSKWNKAMAIWKTAPKPEDYGLTENMLDFIYIPITSVLSFGAQHVKLFGFRLLSELSDFQEFLSLNGIRYNYLKKEDGKAEIQFEREYKFFFDTKFSMFNLTINSSDGIHITSFYFYLPEGFKNEKSKKFTRAEMHDFFMSDKRITMKKVKSEKDDKGFIQDYIAPYEAVRIENDHLFITTIEEYNKMPKYRFEFLQSPWVFLVAAIFITCFLGYLVYTSNQDKIKEQQTDSKDMNYVSVPDDVYICTGPRSRSYHTDINCYGLQSCSSRIIEMSLDEAKERGRRPCRYCCE